MPVCARYLPDTLLPVEQQLSIVVLEGALRVLEPDHNPLGLLRRRPALTESGDDIQLALDAEAALADTPQGLAKLALPQPITSRKTRGVVIVPAGPRGSLFLLQFTDDAVAHRGLQGEGLFELVEQRLGRVCVVTVSPEPRDKRQLRIDALLAFRDKPVGLREMLGGLGSLEELLHLLETGPDRELFRGI